MIGGRAIVKKKRDGDGHQGNPYAGEIMAGMAGIVKTFLVGMGKC